MLYPWRSVIRVCVTIGLVVLFILTPLVSQSSAAGFWNRSKRVEPKLPVNLIGGVSEAAPPPLLQELQQVLDKYQPQVTIVSPRSGKVLSDTTVAVKFRVTDLPIFKNADFGLGPHLHVLLDNQPYQAVYNLNEPLVFEHLQPGTHTIRAFASRPWHESFKNEGAFAQTTFHVFTKTQENAPEPGLPLLTYSRPQGSYGAEPILLDYYLNNAPLHLVAQADDRDEVADWRIRATVNGQSFTLDRWQPIYLKGFKPGQNWVQLEYLDGQGNPIQNPFNNTARIVTYEPGGTDILSRIVRGEMTIADVRGIVDPTYVSPVPELEPILPQEVPTEETPVIEDKAEGIEVEGGERDQVEEKAEVEAEPAIAIPTSEPAPPMIDPHPVEDGLPDPVPTQPMPEPTVNPEPEPEALLPVPEKITEPEPPPAIEATIEAALEAIDRTEPESTDLPPPAVAEPVVPETMPETVPETIPAAPSEPTVPTARRSTYLDRFRQGRRSSSPQPPEPLPSVSPVLPSESANEPTVEVPAGALPDRSGIAPGAPGALPEILPEATPAAPDLPSELRRSASESQSVPEVAPIAPPNPPKAERIPPARPEPVTSL